MKIILGSVSALVTTCLIILFGTRLVLPAPLGKLLSPQYGVWQNAEATNFNYSEELSFPQLKGKAEVFFDERLVPHVFAENEQDVYFIQGFLHAKFRLWQMDFETHAAAGRISELLGDKLGNLDVLNKLDRYYRRLGIPYAAEKSLAMIEADTTTKNMCDAYTAGVNAFIGSLTVSQLPLEYKLLGYNPEPWSNYKSALFIKYMAFDLAGGENDFEFTAARNALTKIDYELLNPIRPDSLDPIIPVGTLFTKPGITVTPPASADSLYFNYHSDTSALPEEPIKPNQNNGSNNWVVNGKKTRSGFPILCNDPHLGLNLPSLWYEMQLVTPTFNVYGVSFPAGPGIIIGFNDSCAFGVTNAGRDVRDYYQIQFQDASRRTYLYNGEWKQTDFRVEHIKIKGKPDFLDTVAYTVFGPVMYDNTYKGRGSANNSYAVRWKAHDPSNELKMFNGLSKAKNYNDYLAAIKNLHTPGQNCAFAAKNGDIALWCQGEFPAKWRRQGDFVMPGTDSSYSWQGMIPQEENPHMYNPERNFVSSANQFPVDSTYPYYIGGGGFPNYRGWIINKKLSGMADVTPQDMMDMQTNNYNVFAEMARPALVKHMDEASLNEEEKHYWDVFKEWNLRSDTGEAGPIVFELLWDALEKEIWHDDAKRIHGDFMPSHTNFLEGLLKDSAYTFADNIETTQKEYMANDLLAAFKKIVPELRKAAAEGKRTWVKYKDTEIRHLTQLPALSKLHVPIGGGVNIINAAGKTHGPSWRMVVSLTPKTSAYGVYPGGQNGNPGSRFYDDFVDSWANGKYYPLWAMQQDERSDKRIKFTMTFNNN